MLRRVDCQSEGAALPWGACSNGVVFGKKASGLVRVYWGPLALPMPWGPCGAPTHHVAAWSHCARRRCCESDGWELLFVAIQKPSSLSIIHRPWAALLLANVRLVGLSGG